LRLCVFARSFFLISLLSQAFLARDYTRGDRTYSRKTKLDFDESLAIVDASSRPLVEDGDPKYETWEVEKVS